MIASRWTWLQAQVSDLEYRIRQQSDLYRQLRSLKGTVTFSDPSSETLHPVNGTIANGGSNKASLLSGSGSEASIEPCDGSMANSASCRAARCLPVRPCRRRRLLRPGDIVSRPSSSHHRRAAASVSTVRCASCQPPATPCALCAGRHNYAASLPTHLPALERIARLDPAYHPVLSFNRGKSSSLSVVVGISTGCYYFFSFCSCMHHWECVAPYVDISLHRRRSWARLTASFSVRL